MARPTTANIKTARSRTASAKGSPVRGRGRPREFDRQEGLAKALRLFWTFGYEATSMSDLRAALGVTQASLYAAYGNKESLFREVVDLYQRTDGITTPRALQADLKAREAIHAMLQDAVDVFSAPGAPGGCLIVLGTINCSVGNMAVQDHMSSLRRETLKSIRARLQRGKREGDVPEDVHVESVAAFYTTVLHGISIQSRDGALRKELTEVVDSAMATWDHFARQP